MYRETLNLKNLTGILLLLFVFASIAYMAVKPSTTTGSAASVGTASASLPKIEGVEPEIAVYFFYNDIRCDVCLRLEAYAVEALKIHFMDELESGAIQWRMLSMDNPENEHYLTEYELYSKSIVLVRFENGEEVRAKNLEDIWDLVYDRPDYVEYIRMEINDFLGTAS